MYKLINIALIFFLILLLYYLYSSNSESSYSNSESSLSNSESSYSNSESSLSNLESSYSNSESSLSNSELSLSNSESSLSNPESSYYNDYIIDHFELTPKFNKNTSYNNIGFITLTNTGYIDYTLNCLESLKRINMRKRLEIYCIGKEGYNKLQLNNVSSNLIDDEEHSDFIKFKNPKWANITYYKFEIIYPNLLKYEYVCFTDGDIVYENNCIFDYLLNNIEDNDMLIQTEDIDNTELCSGFMFIKSNNLTLELFNPENIKKLINNPDWNDQLYINEIRDKIKYKVLPLELFPTGNYYYNNSDNINPYMIHFNWVVGHQKKQKMISYNKWFNKVKICQFGTDGFGHQLEGMLRLLSLSINNKADYQYDYRKDFKFEHNNFSIENLKQYLLKALEIISNNKIISQQEYNVSFNEQRTFEDIIINDVNYNNTIYLYDGVCSNIPDKLPPNFESVNEIQKSLPKLREAFVEKNKYLPKQSYNNNLINVCCHIRLGDAVGQRILDNYNLFKVIKYYQKDTKYNIIIHTDGDVRDLESSNTRIYGSETDILQVLSDFIFADILIINYSSLSIAGHLLANDTQKVICPTNADVVFKHRILNKCISCDDFLNDIEFN